MRKSWLWIGCWIYAVMVGVTAIFSIVRPESDLQEKFQTGLPSSVAGQGRILFVFLNLIVITGVASFVTYAFRKSKLAFSISLAAPLALIVRDIVIGRLPSVGIFLGLFLIAVRFDQPE